MAFVTFRAVDPRPCGFSPQAQRSCALESRRPTSWDVFPSDLNLVADTLGPLSLVSPFGSQQALRARALAEYEQRIAREQARQAHAARVYRQRLIEHQKTLERQRQQQLHEARRRRARLAAALVQQELNARARARRDLALQWRRHQLRDQESSELRADVDRDEQVNAGESASKEPSARPRVTATRLHRQMHANGRVEEVYVRQIGDEVHTVRRNYNPETLTWETVKPKPVEAAPVASGPGDAADADDSKSDAGSEVSLSSESSAFQNLASLFSPTSSTSEVPERTAAESRPETPELDLTVDSDPDCESPPLKKRDAISGANPAPESDSVSARSERSPTPSSLVEIRDVSLSPDDDDDDDSESDNEDESTEADWLQV